MDLPGQTAKQVYIRAEKSCQWKKKMRLLAKGKKRQEKKIFEEVDNSSSRKICQENRLPACRPRSAASSVF
jgi:hypothetical protein